MIGPPGSALTLDVLNREHANLYYDLVLAELSEAARKHLEAFMKTALREYQSEFARNYFGQGKAEGEANALLKILDRRSIPVPDEIRTRITECTDLDQLDCWIGQAATAEKFEDIDF